MVLRLPGSCQHINLAQVVTFYSQGPDVFVHVASDKTLSFRAADEKQAAEFVATLDNHFGGLLDPLAKKTYERKRKST